MGNGGRVDGVLGGTDLRGLHTNSPSCFLLTQSSPTKCFSNVFQPRVEIALSVQHLETKKKILFWPSVITNVLL